MTLTHEPESTSAVQTLSLPEELLLALLNEESGYFHQVPGWNLNCAMAGAALAELSLIGRIDTDLESLIILDATETGHPLLDPIPARDCRRNRFTDSSLLGRALGSTVRTGDFAGADRAGAARDSRPPPW